MSKNGTKSAPNAPAADALKITGNWNAQAKLLKEKFEQLIESDLKFEAGKEEELITRLENRLKKKANRNYQYYSKRIIRKSIGLKSTLVLCND